MYTHDTAHASTGSYERDYLAWYRRMNDAVGEPFDATLLVRLAQQQWSDRPALALAFARCTAIWKDHTDDGRYTYFVAPMHRTARWHFAGSLFLDHPQVGTLLVDVLHDAAAPGGLSIGGMEYMDRVLGRPTSAKEMNAVRLQMAARHTATRHAN